MIEIKKNELDLNRIRIPLNYVLIKPDPHYETFQREGVDLGIQVSNFSYNEKGERVSIRERNYSVMGTVYAVPENLIFNGAKLRKIGDDTGIRYSDGEPEVYNKDRMSEVSALRTVSLRFGSDMEVKVGDRVRFSYTVHMKAVDKGMEIDTPEGAMFFTTYDNLFAIVDEESTPIKMLNGYILVEGEKKDLESIDGVEGEFSESGLFIPNLKTKHKRKRKSMEGRILAIGSPISGHLDFFMEGPDPHVEMSVGEKLLFDPRGCKRLEPLNHQHHKEDLFILHRRSIIFVGDIEKIMI